MPYAFAFDYEATGADAIRIAVGVLHAALALLRALDGGFVPADDAELHPVDATRDVKRRNGVKFRF